MRLTLLSVVIAFLDACTPGKSGVRKSTQWVPMRDGVRLETRLFLPKGDGPFPVILHRGYGPGLDEDGEYFASHGYAYVGQATRGHGRSEGKAHRFFDDAEDGWDTLEWISKAPWCNGNVAMYGKSYMAITQWRVAPLKHPVLKALVPQNASNNPWRHGYWSHGALTLAMTAVGRAFDRAGAEAYGWERALSHLPLIDLDREVSGREDRLWNEYITHSEYDDYWRAISSADKLGAIDLPVFLMGGWYDYYAGSALDDFATLSSREDPSDVRVSIGATNHLNRIVGDRDLSGGRDNHRKLARRWLDWVLKGEDDGISKEPPVRFFLMGANEWRQADRWPPTGTTLTPYYLHVDGSLAREPPAKGSPPSRFDYDPSDPAPALGGSHSMTKDVPGLRVGPVDQRPNAARKDILSFYTAPLPADLTVVGPVEVRLWASSSAPDTDFVAKLLDVEPDGTAWNLSEGIIRARFREDVLGEPKPLVPGQIYEFRIELRPTANVFRKGHRIGVQITSSNFPLWDRNPNTGAPQGLDKGLRVAHQTIWHDRAHPSQIVLPVSPTP